MTQRTRSARLAAAAPGLLLGAAFVLLTVLEERRPLRRRAEPKARRLLRNLTVAAGAAAAVRLTEAPVALRAARLAERHRLGVTRQLPLARPWADALAIVLLDYTLYVWHVLTHRVPLLWRFHLVHHADRELDASTALRFHFGELVLSTAFRAAQVLLIGVSERALGIWQKLTLLSVMFHHSNLCLPPAWDRRLARLVVTPRLHGIHHSVRTAERNSNWSSGLTVWDRLHGTLCTGVPQERIEIGVPDYREAQAVRLPRLLALPFRR